MGGSSHHYMSYCTHRLVCFCRGYLPQIVILLPLKWEIVASSHPLHRSRITDEQFSCRCQDSNLDRCPLRISARCKLQHLRTLILRKMSPKMRLIHSIVSNSGRTVTQRAALNFDRETDCCIKVSRFSITSWASNDI